MRRKRRNEVTAHRARTREELEALYGNVLTVQDVAKEFVITAIIDHTVVVRRKANDTVGTLEYQEGPPYLYFNFVQQPNGQ